ncbi:hypothetical protein GCM10007276_09700 [Agaricicola taiwanensis]|uniref:DUF374 domain-containing protein n=1 Tax=Agaricicola taiwanensis TaxID=591372 RepID=A0A8J2YGD5_9RHOB|nr:lysophospholipid acyltransferase family protein [Agaricicola taiwanensis]GGE34372.1 hypothetical protein GCM10007276_09700 [Agaricicola taiwanensis]
MLKRIWRSTLVQETIGGFMAAYLTFVFRTTRWEVVTPDLLEDLKRDGPVIAAMWHGQHFLVSFFVPEGARAKVLISRHGDGEVNAIAIRKLGHGLIRGSGGHGAPDKIRKRGGIQALRDMVRALSEGFMIAMTADVPKVSRVAGEGVALLAKLSGRPIYPVAVVTRWRITLGSWDRATIGLPFSRGVLVLGPAVRVQADAGADAVEEARRQVESELEAVHEQAYQRLGGKPWSARHG